jgi:luciferase family oxidoreductase group 1
MIPFSVLDLSPIPEGGTAAEALANSLDLARRAEALGYRRFWLAEHHSMPGIASAATAVVIAHVAAGTRTIRVGAGGIMLPNHAPLTVAEAFGTLATLYPGRIDLGLGRAPGTDVPTMRALRRHMDGGDRFPQDVVELLGYLGASDPLASVRAIPGEGTGVPVWILGSSLYGAQLAAHLGLPYAFASHFAPGDLEPAIEIYRSSFRPSPWLASSRLMLAVNVFAADGDAEARRLRSSLVQAFVNLRWGRPGPLPRPVEDLEARVDPTALAVAERALSCSAVGAPETVRRALADIVARHRPDELILTGQIHDHAARLRSFAIAAEVLAEVQRAPA